MKKYAGYFMCTECFRIHKINISIEVERKSNASLNNMSKFNNCFRCNGKRRLTKKQITLMTASYKIMKKEV